ncbi:MAG: glutamate--cysteine ligase [Deltaproteobacteria bacterium]|nr:glutamate--cysteine ligase [Deltaproteobacteria bacterium]
MSDYIADETGPDAAPIERIEQLLEHFERGAKPRSKFRVGTEYEKAAVDRRTGRAIPFSGSRGVETVLRKLADRYGWEPLEEEGRTIGLSGGRGEITLEPGGQIELSGEPYETLHEADEELREHVQQIVTVGDELDIAFLGLGIQPFSPLEEIEWVPKKRYGIMGPYMAKVGSMGQRMMKQTATVQVNLDFESESDAMQKMRVATGIGPILNALFANSPLSDGKPNGYLSYRGHIWTDTDNDRSGILPFVFEPRAGFADYVEWALDVPMYFVKRGKTYHDLTGVPFRRFWKEGASGLRATVGDFALHLSTLFPEVRLKQYIELRMVDSQPPESMLALSAIAKGVLYEPDCMLGAWDLVKDWSLEERVRLNAAVHRTALATPVRRYRVRDLACELLDIAEEGLRRQQRRDARGETEAVYLERVRDDARRGRCPAEQVLERWNARRRDAAGLVELTAYRLPAAA